MKEIRVVSWKLPPREMSRQCFREIYCRKTFGEHCDIQIAVDYEMKIKICFKSSFWLNMFEYIVGYVYIIYI